MSRLLALLALLAAFLGAATSALAHEVRPAYLEISELPGGKLQVVWKRPIVGEMALPLYPHLAGGLIDKKPDAAVQEYGTVTARWITPGTLAGLEGKTVAVDGLSQSITDALVSLRDTRGHSWTHMLRPTEPSYVINTQEPPGQPVFDYVGIGVMHILTGYDHLLFVLGLVLLVPNRRQLLLTISTFTVTHCVTLSATALGWVKVPSAPVEAVIAMSILCVAVELVQVHRGKAGFSARNPWLVAFSFGLLHGFGFAGALREVGLPADQIPLSLLLFSVGIEIGQVSFVLTILAVLWLAARWSVRLRPRLETALPYVMGPIAAYWAIERAIAAF